MYKKYLQTALGDVGWQLEELKTGALELEKGKWGLGGP